MNPKSRNLSLEAMERGRKLGAATTSLKAREYYADVFPLLRELHDQKLSPTRIAERLNKNGHRLGVGEALQAPYKS